MADDGLEFAADDNDLTSKNNRKFLVCMTGDQLTNISNTYPGQRAFCTVSGGAFVANVLYIRNAANDTWNILRSAGTEENSTVIASVNFSTPGFLTRRFYHYWLMPTTYNYYRFTKIEWQNGDTVSGNVMCGVDILDTVDGDGGVDDEADTQDTTALVALGQEVTQTGTDTLQSSNVGWSRAVQGGSMIGIWVTLDNNTGEFATETGTPGNKRWLKGNTYTIAPELSHIGAWFDTLHRPDLKVYYKGYQ